MLSFKNYTEFKESEISSFLVWLLNNNAHGNEDFLNQIIRHPTKYYKDPESSDSLSETKESMATLGKIVDDAYSVTGVRIINIDAFAGNLYIHVKLFRHAGYPGGETDREMGECSMDFEKVAFTLLMSEYFSYKYSGNRNKYTA